MSFIHAHDAGEPPPSSEFIPFAVPEIRGETDLSSPVWREIMAHGSRLTLRAGTLCSFTGEQLYDMYCVERGRVRIVFDTQEGRQRTLMSFEAGGIFNLACSIVRKNASGQYQCMEDSVIWHVPGSLLQDAESVARTPALTAYALQQMGQVALIHSTFLSDMLMDDFIVRFSRYLVSLVDRHGTCSFPLGITQDRCAVMFGVHRATLGRAVQTLKAEGILGRFTRGSVDILDYDSLSLRAGISR